MASAESASFNISLGLAVELSFWSMRTLALSVVVAQRCVKKLSASERDNDWAEAV